MMEEISLSETESICPECFAVVPAWRVGRGDRIFLKKTCPEHGPHEVRYLARASSLLIMGEA